MTERAGQVLSIHLLREQRTPPQPVAAARAVVGQGLEGDVHGKKRDDDRRQVLILDATTLRDFGLRPGDLREQITVEFPILEQLPAGTRLRIGPVTFELTGPCEPCTHIGTVLDVVDRVAFQQQLAGRRGQLARVVEAAGDGIIRVGDAVGEVSLAASE
ncbi:MAG TPA: MOSC domain-containing protein [bacterium]|jgi:MOSC domain-containing protein YiiM